ncbi:tripartite tricarboxylate transporter substrate-binding protein [Caenimonas aquaedulcis]|uniref:Tripartite tricarboxylate transporter substrate binding protein n=1 Tax=Caenimonas aquaedulcis TaxID=2793270 RepID=A0A931H8Z6_9BURK|nr:tripartite tricarboxylate transporter substrate-binding protein [Caenimonas aquaedulcis]MBG9390592.1 tripartite tricarboxylate transporter substrate binding protein [Caenimonas aquaedulcis]
MTPYPNRMTRRSLLALLLAPVAGGATGESVWPKSKPLRILVGFTAGSATDVMARAIAPDLGRLLGTPVIVDNKPGAGGAIATAQMVQAPADGYTIVLNSSAHAVNPSFNPNLPFDTLRDVSAIGPLGSSLFVMVVAPDRGYRSVADLVAKARAQPGKLNYGSGGIGTGSHLNSAKLVSATGIDVVHVPSKGTPEAMIDTIAGRLDWVFAPAPAAVPLIREGKLQALAVGPATRSLALPSTPSMAEAGFPEAAYASWVGLFASSKTARPIIDALSKALADVVKLPAVQERLVALGTEPMPMSAAEFDRFVASEVKAMQHLVKAARIQPQQ